MNRHAESTCDHYALHACVCQCARSIAWVFAGQVLVKGVQRNKGAYIDMIKASGEHKSRVM